MEVGLPVNMEATERGVAPVIGTGDYRALPSVAEQTEGEEHAIGPVGVMPQPPQSPTGPSRRRGGGDLATFPADGWRNTAREVSAVGVPFRIPQARGVASGQRACSDRSDETKAGEPYEDDDAMSVVARHRDHPAVRGHRSRGILSPPGARPGTRSFAFVNTVRPQPTRGSERRIRTRYQPAIGYSISPLAVAERGPQCNHHRRLVSVYPTCELMGSLRSWKSQARGLNRYTREFAPPQRTSPGSGPGTSAPAVVLIPV